MDIIILTVWAVAIIWILADAFAAIKKHKRLNPKSKRSPWAEELSSGLDRLEREKEELRVNLTLLEFGVNPSAIITAEDVALPEEVEPESAYERARRQIETPIVRVAPDGEGFTSLAKDRIQSAAYAYGTKEAQSDAVKLAQAGIVRVPARKQPVLKKDWDQFAIGGVQ